MGCACVFATSNILVMYILVSKHGKHLLLFEAGAILISDRVMAGRGQVRAVLLACLRWFTLQGVGLGWWYSIWLGGGCGRTGNGLLGSGRVREKSRFTWWQIMTSGWGVVFSNTK